MDILYIRIKYYVWETAMSDNRQLIHRNPQAVSAWELSQPWGIVWYSIA